mmetsp:Transcript_2967/g.7586  ORF Transcript_2967/g.7586 Transcript_2967/m.7586 type:complete len:1710 (-) Transcript_2967:230-5359(-)
MATPGGDVPVKGGTGGLCDCMGYKMRTQLCLSFGVTQVLVFGAFIGIWTAVVFSIQGTFVDTAREYLNNQIESIGARMVREVGDVFLAKMAVGAVGFLWPVAFNMYDTHDLVGPSGNLSYHYSILPNASYAGNQVSGCLDPTMCLAPPAEVYSRYTCTFPQGVCPSPTTSGGCRCTGEKEVSALASSVFATGMDGNEATVMGEWAVLKGQARVTRTSFMDALVRATWRASPDWIQVYMGIPRVGGLPSSGPEGFTGSIRDAPLFRTYPGSVRDGLDDASLPPPKGRSFSADVRGWYKSADAQAHTWPVQSGVSDTGPADGLVDSFPSASAFVSAAATRQLQTARPPVVMTEPYEDADGKGYLISLAAKMSDPKGNSLGVVAIDLLARAVSSMISTIKMRDSGESFLWHIPTGNLIGSQQFTPGVDAPPKISDVKILEGSETTFGQLSMMPCSETDATTRPAPYGFPEPGPEGSSTEQGVVFVWEKMWGGQLCLCMATPVNEIQAPMDDQLDEIAGAVNTLIISSVIILLAVLGVLILMLWFLAYFMAKPLTQMAANTKLVVQNIGGDSKGLSKKLAEEGHPAPSWGDVGEVMELRGRFGGLWHDLAEKRNEVVTEPNHLMSKANGGLFQGNEPAYDVSDASTPMRLANLRGGADGAGDVAVDVSADVARKFGHAVDHQAQFKSPVTEFNKMRSHLQLKLAIPVGIILAVVVGYNVFILYENVTAWMEPIREILIKEERSSLDQRCQQRALLVSEFLQKGTTSLTMTKAYLEDRVNGHMHNAASRNIIASSSSQCLYLTTWADGIANIKGSCSGSSASSTLQCTCDPISTFDEQFPDGLGPEVTGRSINAAYSFTYKPKDPLSRKLDTGSSYYNFPSREAELQVLSDMDHVFRAAYFSNDLTAVYMATHQSEIMHMYPYHEPNYDSSRYCDSVADVAPQTWGKDPTLKPFDSYYKNLQSSTYNPVCRPWYQRAQNAGKQVFNPIDFDASNNEPYLALSTPAVTDQNEMIGVVSLDLNLLGLQRQLKDTQLYESGYAFVWDANGLTVSHKGFQPGLSQYDIAWMDATAGGTLDLDQEYMDQQKAGMWDLGRVTGTWTYKWNGNRDGVPVEETWYYTFAPVPGTPYMIALSNKDEEVTAEADQMIADLQGQVLQSLIFVVCLIVGALGVMTMFTLWFNQSVAVPVMQLADYVGHLKHDNYSKDIPDAARKASSAELRMIFRNIERMVTALRFGNDKYNGGNKEIEMRSCIAALRIIEDLGLERGRGVCFNNMGLCARALRNDPNFDPNSPQYNVTLASGETVNPALNIDDDFRRAVESARMVIKGQEASGQGVDASMSASLSKRLLNWALAKIDTGAKTNNPTEVDAGANLLNETTDSSNLGSLLGTLSFAAFMDVAQNMAYWGGALAPPSVAAALIKMARKALNTRPAEDELKQEGMAEAVAVLCLIEGSKDAEGHAWWAIKNVPQIKKQVFRALVWTLMARLQQNPQRVQELEAALPDADKGVFEDGPDMMKYFNRAPKKIVVFLVDRTWGPIVQIAFDSICMVFDKHLSSRDVFALYGLGDGFVIHPTAKSLVPRELIQANAKLSGSCRLSGSMIDALNTLNGYPDLDKWLVVLTDTVDLDPNYLQNAATVTSCIERLSSINIALVNSEKISGWEPRNPKWPSFRENVRKFVGAAGSTGHLLPADNAEAVGTAFEKVAALMSGGMSEAL